MKINFKLFTLFTLMTFASACGNGNSANAKVENNSQGEVQAAAVSDNDGKPIHINRAQFLEKIYDFQKNPDKWVYNGKVPAIVDFYADWCGPCKQVAPILEQLAAEYKGKIIVYKINTDAEQQLAGEFGIDAIPTLMFIPVEGKPQVSQGALSKDQLKSAIDNFLLKK